jgi:hypothetical protein
LHIAIEQGESNFLDIQNRQRFGLVPGRRGWRLDRPAFRLRQHEPVRLVDEPREAVLLLALRGLGRAFHRHRHTEGHSVLTLDDVSAQLFPTWERRQRPRLDATSEALTEGQQLIAE